MTRRSLAAVAAVLLAALPLCFGQQIHRNGFAGRQTAWVRGAADAQYREQVHELTEEFAHSLPSSEVIKLNPVELGSYVHYHYPTPPALLTEEFAAGVYVKANKRGLRLLARVVLPRERDPQNPAEPMTVVVPGDAYTLAGRWQQLTLPRPVTKLLRAEQQKMRALLGRDVDVTDAHIDRLILNLYASPGPTEVWIDDLEFGPVAPDKQVPTLAPRTPGTPAAATASQVTAVEVTRDQLLVGGKRFFLRGVRHAPGVPLKEFRDFGFNTVFFDQSATPAHLEEAVASGLWVVPTLPLREEGEPPLGSVVSAPDPRTGRLTSANKNLLTTEALAAEISRFSLSDSVLFWSLGGGRRVEQVDQVARTASAVRAADTRRPVSAVVWDGLWPYSRQLDLVSVKRWPFMTGLELVYYRQWLEGRRLLARPGTYLWAWVQTHTPDWYRDAVPPRPGEPGPAGPTPGQVRLAAYSALAAGYKGVSFWTDESVADGQRGTDRLQSLALLNQELLMLEPLLMAAGDPAKVVPTSDPHVQAAVVRTERGVLVLPMWLGGGAQFVPGQSAAQKIDVLVPQPPQDATAWEVSPGRVRALPMRRLAGGVQVTIPVFDTTAAVVLTGDLKLVSAWQDHQQKSGRLAASWMIGEASAEYARAAKGHARLEPVAPVVPDAVDLLTTARERLGQAKRAFDYREYGQAFEDARGAARSARLLMRAHWENASRGLDAPTASPYAVAYDTLPRHWELFDTVRRGRVGPDQLGGHFEPAGYVPEPGRTREPAAQLASRPKAKPPAVPTLTGLPAGWRVETAILDDLETTVGVSDADAFEGRRSLVMQTRVPTPKAAGPAPPAPPPPPPALDRTFLAVHSPTVRLPAGTLVRVSVAVKTAGLVGSPDGVLIYDSAGGEPLAVRLPTATLGKKTDPETKKVEFFTDWKRFHLYRTVPASGTISVTVALTGVGSAYFDEFRIEPVGGP